jgi:hypothetical protein
VSERERVVQPTNRTTWDWQAALVVCLVSYSTSATLEQMACVLGKRRRAHAPSYHSAKGSLHEESNLSATLQSIEEPLRPRGVNPFGARRVLAEPACATRCGLAANRT